MVLTGDYSQGTSVLLTLPLGKWRLAMGLLRSPWHSPCSRRPLSTSWYKQMRRSLYKTPSFKPKLTCTPLACQYGLTIRSPGNGLTPKRAMLSACRPEVEGVREKKGPDEQDGRAWPHFLMGDTWGWEKEAGRSSSLLVWAAMGVLKGWQLVFRPQLFSLTCISGFWQE